MIIESKTNGYYMIKCEKCDLLIKKHRIYCKQYGDEFIFNPAIVCTCGNIAKSIYLRTINSVVKEALVRNLVDITKDQISRKETITSINEEKHIKEENFRLNEEIIRYIQEKSVLNNENIKLKSKYDEMQYKIQAQVIESSNYSKDTSRSFTDIFRIKQFKEEIFHYSEKLKNAIKENSELITEIERIKSQYIEIKLENQTFKTTILDNSNELVKFRDEIFDYQEAMAVIIEGNGNLREELEKIKSQNSEIRLENQTYKIKKLDSDIDNARLRDEVISCKEEMVINIERNEKLKKELEILLPEYMRLELENQNYKVLFTDEHNDAINIKEQLINLQNKKDDLDNVILIEENQISDLKNEIKKLKNEIVVLDDEILYQSFCLYTPLYDLTSTKEYKYQLDEVRILQKQMLKNDTAATCNANWTVDGNRAKGKKMTNSNIKQILRSFNNECENVIDRVKFNNIDSMKNRITKAFESLNNLNETNSIVIQQEFLELKYQELSLAYEYQLEKQNEKDDLRMLREQQREEAKLQKEIEDRRREIEKEQQHYNNALSRLDDQISFEKSEERLQYLLNKKNDIQNNLIDLDLALKEIDYREANQRAGYVYIISNIGAFGENIYKIGMTRRLDPQDRVDELGNASVPFKFDIHAMIFSDNAPKLENSLHKAFDHKKINSINSRKEFFNVTLEEIEEVVKSNHDRTVDFINIPPAQQYRETLKKREKEFV
jgi:hypothetical protein